MPNTEEQRLDLIENCNLLLNGILKPFDNTDDTPEGRMITQCRWLKERAENHDLPLPVNRGKLGSLLYIYTNGELYTGGTPEKEVDAAEVFMQRIIRLAKKGQLLTKPPYTPYALRSIDALIRLLQTASRPLSQYEQSLIPDLKQLRQLLDEGKIEPPLGAYGRTYPSINEAQDSIEDIPNGKIYIRRVINFIFNGVRPDTWLTPEDADRETQNL